METAMSTSVSTFKLPIPTSLEFSLLRTPIATHHLPPILHPHLSTKPNHSISPKPSSTASSPRPFPPSSSSSSTQPPPTTTHRKPATGYAAALVDVAVSSNKIAAVCGDVKRLARLLRNELVRGVLTDPGLEEREKGAFLKEVAEKGKFDPRLVGLLKMMVEKGKLGMVGEVLAEFQLIYDDLCGTRRFTTTCVGLGVSTLV